MAKQLKPGLSPELQEERRLWYKKEKTEREARKKAAAALGSIKTPKKASASRANGKKGGRPKVCKECKHSLSLHTRFYNKDSTGVVCTKDNCTKWNMCSRSHTFKDLEKAA